MNTEKTENLSIKETKRKVFFKRAILIILIILIICGAAYAYLHFVYSDHLKEQAQSSFDNKEYEKALSDYRILSYTNSLSDQELTNMAICSSAIGDISKSKSIYQDLYATTSDPKYLMLEDSTNVGNYSGNQSNTGYLVEDLRDNKVYIANFSNDSAGMIYRFNLDQGAGGEEVVNLNDPTHEINYMNIIDDYLYFIAVEGDVWSDYAHRVIDRVNIRDNNKKIETVLQSADTTFGDFTNMTSIGNVLYLYRSQFDNNGYELISLNLDGKVEVLRQNMIPSALTSDGVNLYGIDNNEIFKLTPSGDYEILESLTEPPIENKLIVYKDNLYYASDTGGFDGNEFTLYSISTFGDSNSIEVIKENGNSPVFNIFNDNIYYSFNPHPARYTAGEVIQNMDTIYSYNLVTNEKKVILNQPSDPKIYGHDDFNKFQTVSMMGDIMVTQSNLYYRVYESGTPRGTDYTPQGFYMMDYNGIKNTLMK